MQQVCNKYFGSGERFQHSAQPNIILNEHQTSHCASKFIKRVAQEILHLWPYMSISSKLPPCLASPL